MLNAVKYRLPLHACQGSFEFFYTLLCRAEVFLCARRCFQRNAASRPTHPLHAWQKLEITIVVSLSCIKCFLMDSKSLPIEGIPQIPFSPFSNKPPELVKELAVISFLFLFTEHRLANTGLAFLQNNIKASDDIFPKAQLRRTIFRLYSRCHFPEENKEIWSEIAVFNW